MLTNLKKCRYKKEQKKKGFSLIEMVVVIALMAILALITAPNLTAYIQKSESAKIRANLKTVYTSVQLTVQSNPKISIKDLQIDAVVDDRLGSGGANLIKDEIAKYANVDQSVNPIVIGGRSMEGLYVISSRNDVPGGLEVTFETDTTRYSYDGSNFTETTVQIDIEGPR